MSKYNVDFEAWTTIEADTEEQAITKAQELINLISQLLELKDIELEMVVRDDGISEE